MTSRTAAYWPRWVAAICLTLGTVVLVTSEGCRPRATALDTTPRPGESTGTISGIVAGCIIVFMLTIGNFATPVLLGGKNGLWFTEQIYAQFITRFNWPQGAAFGMLLLLLSSAIVWLGLRLTGQSLGTTLKQA